MNLMIAEDFNKKMMMPSQSRDDLVSLHGEAKLLFNTYIRYGTIVIFSVASLLLCGCYRHSSFSSIERLLSAH
jgi:hypothetical protein